MAGLFNPLTCPPDRPAFVIGDGEFRETYAELEARSAVVAHWLRSLGLQRGDCVAILLDNNERFFDIYWGVQRTGLYLVPINWHLRSSEVDYILENSGARVLLAAAAVGAVAEELAARQGSAPCRCWCVGGELDGYEPLEARLAEFEDAGPLEEQSPGSVMIYSSGTTGRPKGIRKPLPDCSVHDDSFINAQTRFIRLFGFESGDRYLCPAPLYHAAPARSCAATHLLGGTVFVMRRFEAEQALAIIDHQRIQVSQWVPTHFKRLLGLADETRSAYRTDSLRLALHAAAPCPVAVKRAMIDWWGPILTEYYAGTEGGGTVIRSPQWLRHEGSVGRPWQGVDLALIDERGDPVVAAGSEGAVYFRDNLAGKFSYHGDEAKTRQVYRDDWFTLGDIGYRDEQGYLYLTDRQSNMIICGGVNIYPQEIENCLLGHPKVYDVAVIGVPDEDMGEQIKAVVIPEPGVEAGDTLAQELIEFCRQHIASYKAPRSVDFTDSLPRTETGKLVKRTLQERYLLAAKANGG